MSEVTVKQGVDVGAKAIGKYVNDHYQLLLEDHFNGLECRATITVTDKDNSIPPAELIAILRHHDITDAVDLEQVAIFCSEAALGENPENVLIASGQEPVRGNDGWFELVVTTGREENDLLEDEQGRVDFKAIQTFSNIEEGQVIGNIYLPTEGAPGKTIYGATIEPQPGKPCGVIAGAGVRFNEEGTQAVAGKQGRVLFEKKVLSITDELVINGDVDLSIGHVNFNGFVDIKGDVLDDFNITATKGINITGAVGNCQITSGGPVTIGTMAGMGKGKITCNGAFQARYLNQATVECWGEVAVSHEIRNSTVKSTRSVTIPKGLITGGNIVTLEGIEARMLGTNSGAKTHLTSGVYFPEADRLQFLRTRLKDLVDQLNKIKATLKALHGKPLARLRPALRDAFQLRIDILTQRQSNLEGEQQELENELSQFSREEHPTATPKINVLDKIRDGVVCHLGQTSGELPTDVSGPISVVEDKDDGTFRYLTYSALHLGIEAGEAETV